MNHYHFSGRLAKAVTLSGHGEKAVAKLTLIRNDYAGKDKQTGDAMERQVAIPFTAFRGTGEAIAKHCLKGDQLNVVARIENNRYVDKDGVEQFGFNFIIDDFEFGAPGPEKRSDLASRQRTEAAARESAPA